MRLLCRLLKSGYCSGNGLVNGSYEAIEGVTLQYVAVIRLCDGNGPLDFSVEDLGEITVQ